MLLPSISRRLHFDLVIYAFPLHVGPARCYKLAFSAQLRMLLASHRFIDLGQAPRQTIMSLQYAGTPGSQLKMHASSID